MAVIQEKIAFLPDYNFRAPEEETNADAAGAEAAWPAVDAGTSVSGLAGGVMTLLLAGMAGYCIYLVKKRNKAKPA